MQTILIFLTIYAAMIANSFWEAYVEGRNAWDKHKIGWKLKFRGKVLITAYHFWLFVVMYPLLLSLPLIIYGFDLHLLGILISAYFSGLMIEDFFWFVVNPTFKLKNWNSKNVTWYPWIKILKFEIPLYYVINLIIAFASWQLLWR